ncbi:MAG: molybdopterin-synthase adenylyltransferase MoeB [Gammaproteobacteria bacterium]|nr:MAG: molybdopterin-synthase adenylyltransferase MoeB [Gammaproteobacteria bacterium]
MQNTNNAAALNPEEIQRYSRHLLLPEVGIAGQQKLKHSQVLVIGAGGLGCPVLLYLAAAGVGHLGIVDDDKVDLSNLQRQVLFSVGDLDKSKALVAQEKIQALNPNTAVTVYQTRLNSANALEIFKNYDVIVDCTDNFATRYLSNDACVILGKPNVYASIFRFDGQLSIFNYRNGPCYRCLYPTPPPPELVPSCAEGGVVGILPGVLGTLQATEVIKILLDIGDVMAGRLLTFDALTMSFDEYQLKRNHNCTFCSTSTSERKLIDYQEFCGIPAAQNNSQDIPSIQPMALKHLLSTGEPIQLIDVRSISEHQIANIKEAQLLPLDSLEQEILDLDKHAKTICFCHKGKRSQKACEILLQHGFSNILNLSGGIDRWSLEASIETPRY